MSTLRSGSRSEAHRSQVTARRSPLAGDLVHAAAAHATRGAAGAGHHPVARRARSAAGEAGRVGVAACLVHTAAAGAARAAAGERGRVVASGAGRAAGEAAAAVGLTVRGIHPARARPARGAAGEAGGVVARGARRAAGAAAAAGARAAARGPVTAAVARERLTDSARAAAGRRGRGAGIALADTRARGERTPTTRVATGTRAGATAIARGALHGARVALTHVGARARRAPGAAVETDLDAHAAASAGRLASLAGRAHTRFAGARDAAPARRARRRARTTRRADAAASLAAPAFTTEAGIAALAFTTRLAGATTRSTGAGFAHQDTHARFAAGAARPVRRAAPGDRRIDTRIETRRIQTRCVGIVERSVAHPRIDRGLRARRRHERREKACRPPQHGMHTS